MIIYHNPRCRKSREALQIIQDLGIDYEIIEYLKKPLTEADLKDLVKKLGVEAKLLLRKNESVFKEKYSGKKIGEKEVLKAIAENPILMERPVVVKGNKAVIGRPPEKIMELI